MVSGVTRDTHLITEKNPNKKYYFIIEKIVFKKYNFQKIEKFEDKKLKMVILNENSK